MAKTGLIGLPDFNEQQPADLFPKELQFHEVELASVAKDYTKLRALLEAYEYYYPPHVSLVIARKQNVNDPYSGTPSGGRMSPITTPISPITSKMSRMSPFS